MHHVPLHPYKMGPYKSPFDTHLKTRGIGGILDSTIILFSVKGQKTSQEIAGKLQKVGWGFCPGSSVRFQKLRGTLATITYLSLIMKN